MTAGPLFRHAVGGGCETDWEQLGGIEKLLPRDGPTTRSCVR
jgi:hypothetical protein